LFSATDPGGYAITEYYFYDKSPGNGYWALNGIAQPSGQVLKVDPAQLSQVTFHSATTGGDDLLVCAENPYAESRWTEFNQRARDLASNGNSSNVPAGPPGQIFADMFLFLGQRSRRLSLNVQSLARATNQEFAL
jgi:hypothetical protein